MTGEISIPFIQPGQDGIYFLRQHGRIVYVGITNSFYGRISHHMYRKDIEFDSVSFLPTPGRARASFLEDRFIQCLQPKYNRCMKTRGAKARHTAFMRSDIAKQLAAVARVHAKETIHL